MSTDGASPITLALIDDYDIVVVGVAHMFDAYQDRVEVCELDASMPLREHVDIALYDSFAQPEPGHEEVARLVRSERAGRVVMYTWNFHPDQIDAAYEAGVSGYLSKTLPAAELVESLERIQGGERITSPAPNEDELSVGLDWPGRTDGLSERESEILALITQGKSNAEITELTYLSINSVKTYIRNTYRKICAKNRVDAVLWGVDHGFKPDHRRIDDWVPFEYR